MPSRRVIAVESFMGAGIAGFAMPCQTECAAGCPTTSSAPGSLRAASGGIGLRPTADRVQRQAADLGDDLDENLSRFFEQARAGLRAGEGRVADGAGGFRSWVCQPKPAVLPNGRRWA